MNKKDIINDLKEKRKLIKFPDKTPSSTSNIPASNNDWIYEKIVIPKKDLSISLYSVDATNPKVSDKFLQMMKDTKGVYEMVALETDIQLWYEKEQKPKENNSFPEVMLTLSIDGHSVFHKPETYFNFKIGEWYSPNGYGGIGDYGSGSNGRINNKFDAVIMLYYNSQKNSLSLSLIKDTSNRYKEYTRLDNGEKVISQHSQSFYGLYDNYGYTPPKTGKLMKTIRTEEYSQDVEADELIIPLLYRKVTDIPE